MRRSNVVRRSIFLCTLSMLTLVGCGQSEDDQQALSAQGDPIPEVLAPVDEPTRALSRVLPGDDPTFTAAIDAFDGEVLEQRTIAVSGLVSSDLGGGYFGQRFFQSLWTPVSDDVAMRVCHELVAYANEIDFPATEIVVTQKSYADFEWSQDLVTVDASGSCVVVSA